MKRLVKLVGCFFLLAFFILSILPSFLSTQLAKPLVSKVLLSFADLDEFRYDTLSIGWLTDSQVQGLHLRLKDKKTTIQIEEIQTNKTLFSFFINSLDLGELSLKSPHITHSIPQIFSNVQPLDLSKKEALSTESISSFFTEPFLQVDPGAFLPNVYRGRLTLHDATCEIADGKGQPLLLLQTPLTHFRGDFSNEGIFAFKTEMTVWEGIEGSQGSIRAALAYGKETAFKGVCDVNLPALSTLTLAPLLQSLDLKKISIPPLDEIIGPTALLTFSWQGTTKNESTGSFLFQAEHMKAHVDYRLLNGSDLILSPGELFSTEVTSEAFSHLLRFYNVSIPLQLLESLNLSAELQEPLTLNLLDFSTKDSCLFHISSQEALWKYNKTPFYTNLECLANLNDHKAQCSLNATVKKDKEASELTSILLEVDASKIKDNHTQFSIGASLEGGFLSSFLEAPYKRVVKEFAQHPITWKIALKGLLKASSEIEAQGEMFFESSAMKHHSQFSFTEGILKVDHAHIDLSFMPTALFPNLGGSPCSLNATFKDIVIPLTSDYIELANNGVIDSSLSLAIPSLSCNGKKILNNAMLFVSFIKDPKDSHIRLQVEEAAQIPVQNAICDLAGFIPEHTSIKIAYQMLTKDFSLDAHIHGNDYKFQGHVDGLCDIENKEIMITTPWVFSFLINKKDSLFRCLPFSFQSLNVNGTPLHISFQDNKIDFKKDTTVRCDILGVFSEKTPSFDTSMVCSLNAAKGLVDMQITASDSDKKNLLSASGRIDKKLSLSSHVDLFPAIIPFFEAYQKIPSIYKDFQEAHADITFKDIRQPFLDGKASVIYTSSLLHANGILSCKNGIFQLKKQDEKTPLFRLVITDDSLQKLKQLCKFNNSLHFLSPLSVTIPLCSLKAQYDQDLKKITSLDGDFLLSSEPFFAQVNNQEYSLVGTTLSAHIDNEKKATCTIRSSPSIKTQAKTSVSGDCTIEYQDPVHMLTLENTKIKASVEVQDIPSEVLRVFFSKGDSVSEILKPSFSFDLHFTSDKTKEGVFQFHLKAQNASCSLDSAEIKNGVLSFSSPLLLKLLLDKKRGSDLLKNIIPFLSSGLTKPHEISIEVSPENTFIPIKNWSLLSTSIPKITLTIGKVEVKRTGLLDTILKTLRVSSKKSASLWFTPIHASLQNGTITLERFDMQASDSIHLIVWGKANFINSSLGMYTAIPEDTFKRLGLYLSIPRPLILPIRGTFDDPEINMIKFTARMAGAGAATYGALEGALGIVGGALQIASTLGEDDVPIPPPLELPFPWDK